MNTSSDSHEARKNDLNPFILFKEASVFFRSEKKLMILFWFFFSAFGIFSYWYRQDLPESSAQITQAVFEVLFVFFNVFFLHALNLRAQKMETGPFRVVGEGFLLSFGFILQSLFWALSVLLGGLLLIIPGLICMVVFFLAPMLSVLYPDYEGGIFLLAKEFFWPRFMQTLVYLIAFGILLPYFPYFIHFGVTGLFESSYSYFLIPVSNFFYVIAETCLFSYVFRLVSRHRHLNLS